MHGNYAYFARRLLLMIPTFIGITMLCFALTQFVPGGPVEQMMMRARGLSGGGEAAATASSAFQISEEQRAIYVKHFGFDRPFLERYWNWLVRDCIGMRTKSYKFSNRTAWEMISSRFPVSLIFGLSGFILTYLVCVPLGVCKALRHGGVFDFISSVFVFIGYAMPVFALGMLVKMSLCGTVDGMWSIFPASGFHSQNYEYLGFWGKFWDCIWHMCLPVLCYMAGNFAVLTLLMKNSLLEQLNSDYIRTVYAKGGSRRLAIWGHALRNALIPLATGFGSVLTLMFAGSVIIERVFEIPGMGNLSLEAVAGRDYPVFMGIVSLTSLLSLFGNVVSDFCYVMIDPRINFNKQ